MLCAQLRFQMLLTALIWNLSRSTHEVEWDSFCQSVLASRIQDGLLPAAKILGDIESFHPEQHPEAAVCEGLVGGFPCQVPWASYLLFITHPRLSLNRGAVRIWCGQGVCAAGKQAGMDDPRSLGSDFIPSGQVTALTIWLRCHCVAGVDWRGTFSGSLMKCQPCAFHADATEYLYR